MIAFVKGVVARGADGVALAGVQHGYSASTVGELARVAAPVLVVCGTDDRINGEPAPLARALPAGQLVEVPGDHLAALLNGQFTAALREFLRSSSPANAASHATPTDCRYEFGTVGWVAAARDALDELFDGVDLAGIDYSFSEEYSNPPRHLSADGTSIGWSFRISGGTVDVVPTPDLNADVRITADYEVVLPVARMVVDGDPAIDEALARHISDAAAAGRFAVGGDTAKARRWRQLDRLRELHDAVARRTI